jgi:hypothetical protein
MLLPSFAPFADNFIRRINDPSVTDVDIHNLERCLHGLRDEAIRHGCHVTVEQYQELIELFNEELLKRVKASPR